MLYDLPGHDPTRGRNMAMDMDWPILRSAFAGESFQSRDARYYIPFPLSYQSFFALAASLAFVGTLQPALPRKLYLGVELWFVWSLRREISLYWPPLATLCLPHYRTTMYS
jgi:hypothetical protein